MRAESKAGLTLRKLPGLARNPRWRHGFLLLAASAVLQVTALALAPVSLVAPIAALSLPIVAVINVHSAGSRASGAFWAAVTASVLGVGTFVAVVSRIAIDARLPGQAALQAGGVVALVVGSLGVLGLARRGVHRSILLGTGAGVAYGLMAVLLRQVSVSARLDGLGGVPLLSVAGLVVAFLVGAWFVQLSYASGPPDLVVACQTLLNSVTAAVIGLGVARETSNVDGWTAAALITCGLAAAAGVAAIVRNHPDLARG
ncbi:MAG: hypothetical protein HOY78_31080 [Saccharothrix sp.]|nr:hypothetical protein [Saccharothrix sp.]